MSSAVSKGHFCRFRDCRNTAEDGKMFCGFHFGSDGNVLDQHTLGSMRAVELTLHRQPDHSDAKRYGIALADTLTKWFGDEAELVAVECVKVLEALR